VPGRLPAGAAAAAGSSASADAEAARLAAELGCARARLDAADEVGRRQAAELARLAALACDAVPREHLESAVGELRRAAEELARADGLLLEARAAAAVADAERAQLLADTAAASAAARGVVRECAEEVDRLGGEVARVRALAAQMVPELEHQAVADELRRALGAASLLERAAQRAVPAAALAEAEAEARRLEGELGRTRERLAGLLGREDVVRAAGEIERLAGEVLRLQASAAEAAARGRELRAELAECRAEAEGLKRALRAAVPKELHDECMAAAVGLRSETERLQRRMAEMVWRSEAEGAHDEAERLGAELKAARALVAASEERSAALREEMQSVLRVLDRKSCELLESVPRAELLEARRALSEARAESSQLRQGLVHAENRVLRLCAALSDSSALVLDNSESRKWHQGYKTACVDPASEEAGMAVSCFAFKEIEGLNHAFGKLQVSLRSTVSRVVYHEMEKTLKGSEAEILRLSQDMKSMVDVVRSYIRAYAEEIEALSDEISRIKAVAKNMVPSVHYAVLYDHALSMSSDLCRIQKSMESSVAKSHLDQIQNRLSAEIQCLTLRIQGMIPKEEFDQAQDQIKRLDCELIRRKSLLESTVSKTLYCTAQDHILECNLEIQRLQKNQENMVSKVLYTSLQDELFVFSQRVGSLQQEMKNMVPLQALDNSEQEIKTLSAEVVAANLLLETKDKQIRTLRDDMKALQMTLDMKCTELLDACPRQEVLHLQSEFSKVKEAEEELLREKAHLQAQIFRYSEKQKLMVPKEEFLVLQHEALENREQLEELKRLLASARLSDTALFRRFLSALKYQHLDGVIQVCNLLERLSTHSSVMIFEICDLFYFLEESGNVLISDIMALLKDLQGPNARSIHEVRRIMHTMNLPFQMSADELCSMRTLLRGMTSNGLDGLQSLLKEGFTVEGIQQLQDELNTYKSKLLHSCETLKKKQCLNDELVQEIAALKLPHAPICTAPYSTAFSDSLTLLLASCDSSAVIYYTTDGRMPGPDCFEGVGTGSSSLELVLSRSCVLKAVCSLEGIGLGKVMTKKFVKKDEKKRERTSNGVVDQLPYANTESLVTLGEIINDRGQSIEKKMEKITPRNSIQINAVGGVGMLLEQHQDSTGSRIIVKNLIKDGAAERDGRIRPGDFLVAVDGRDIRDFKVENVLRLISGMEGSNVELTLERKGVDGSRIRVILTRSAAGFVSSDLL
jgi:hypothetical protein